MIYLRVRPSVGVPETLDGKPCGAVLVMLLVQHDFRLAKKPGLIKSPIRRGWGAVARTRTWYVKEVKEVYGT